MILHIDQINEQTKKNVSAFLESTDEAYRNQLIAIASHIRATHRQRPIVLISGPSGSGKTTTAHMLEQILDAWGLVAHTLSMDNYFKTIDRRTAPRTPEGDIDYESPLCMDMDL